MPDFHKGSQLKSFLCVYTNKQAHTHNQRGKTESKFDKSLTLSSLFLSLTLYILTLESQSCHETGVSHNATKYCDACCH